MHDTFTLSAEAAQISMATASLIRGFPVVPSHVVPRQLLCEKPQGSKGRRYDQLHPAQYGRALLQQAEEQPSAATRYDKTAERFLGFLNVACIRLWLRNQHGLMTAIKSSRCAAFIARRPQGR